MLVLALRSESDDHAPLPAASCTPAVGAPVLALEDLSSRLPIRLVPITGPTADKLAQVFPFYSRGVIPAGTYGANQPPVETIDVGSVLVGRNTMDPELAYGIVRALWHERNAPLFPHFHRRQALAFN